MLAILVAAVSLHTIFGFIFSITGETFRLNLSRNESSGDWELAFNANARNSGLLGLSLFIELTILDLDEKIVAIDSRQVYIGAGGSQVFSITLTIPSEFVPVGDIQNARGLFQLRMSVKTLGDLVGLTQILKIGSGAT